MSTPERSRIAALFADGVTDPPAPRPRWLRRGRVDLVAVADVAVALICFAATNSTLVDQNARAHADHGSLQLMLIALAVCAPLAVRTWLPLTSWSASLIALFWAGRAIPPGTLSNAVYLPAGVLVYLLCLYAVAVRCRPWVVTGAAAVTLLLSAVTNPASAFVVVLVIAIPVLTGVVVRSRRSNRERLAVQERRHVGERALLEERQRIARELHDVVAHHMSVIAIQAEAAPYKVAEPPKELVDSFAEIRASALSGLQELRRVLGVLRSETADVVPQPGLGDLDALLESARGGGVTVATSVTGDPRLLPQGVDLSAYRIVQEALSNAMRHAPGAAVQVKLYYGEAALVIEVRNDGPPAGATVAGAPPAGALPGDAGQDGAAGQDGGAPGKRTGPLGRGGGHGIIGMRERATMLGGYLTAGPTEKGEFLVRAALPLDSTRAGDPS